MAGAAARFDYGRLLYDPVFQSGSISQLGGSLVSTQCSVFEHRPMQGSAKHLPIEALQYSAGRHFGTHGPPVSAA